jgi:alpha-glucosidase
LLDKYGAIAMGEVGDGVRSFKTAGEYTSGGDKLHLCYTFDLLGDKFTPARFAGAIRDFEEAAPDGWTCWAFSNHDVVRHATRWGEAATGLAIMLLVCLRGTVCLYQGEELGLTEANLKREDLRDPYGIRFWPAFKGRDGCRTPMVWEHKAPNAGFSTARPWLPVAPEHPAKAVDMNPPLLDVYRRALQLRRDYPELRHGAIEIVEADETRLVLRRGSMLCSFDFSSAAVDIACLPRP